MAVEKGNKNSLRKPRWLFDANGEIGYFAPKTWQFWECLAISFCLMCWLGHWLEIPWVLFMSNFGIVDETYAAFFDPIYHPYWVYGFGAVIMTFVLEPLKEKIILCRETLVGALAQSFVIIVVLTAALELVIGLIINQPDAITGEYPYWDNSQLPGNILEQAWIANDIAIGIVAMLYIWVIFPLICRVMTSVLPRATHAIFGIIIALFAICCVLSYAHLIGSGILG